MTSIHLDTDSICKAALRDAKNTVDINSMSTLDTPTIYWNNVYNYLSDCILDTFDEGKGIANLEKVVGLMIAAAFRSDTKPDLNFMKSVFETNMKLS